MPPVYLNSYLATYVPILESGFLGPDKIQIRMNARQDLRDQMSEPVSIHLSDISQSRRYDIEDHGHVSEKVRPITAKSSLLVTSR